MAGPRFAITSRKEAMPTLHLVATQIAEPTQIPPSPAPIDLGTRSVFSDDLRDKNTNDLVGQHTGECVLVRKNPNMWLCHAGFILPKGQLVAEVLGGEVTEWTAAILGGTEDYDNARGQIEGKYIPGTGSPPSLNPLKTDYTIEIRVHP
jgi:hypothetical protein